MKQVNSGVLVAGDAGTPRACYSFPSVVALSDGRLLATARHGSSKDGDDEDIDVFAERNGDWVRHASLPRAPVLDGQNGTLKLAYLTEAEPGKLLAAAMWVDRSSFPGQPLFNPETEGCLPMAILLARSGNGGETWSDWDFVGLPIDLGPPSLTCPIFRLGDGRLAMSIETNKTYLDAGVWRQRAVLLTSDDEAETWSAPTVAAQDSDGRIFNWDLRMAAAPDGRVVSFAWTYDRNAGAYRNIHRRVSSTHGSSWTQPEDIGVADQAGRPAILPDGRMVLAWVDRFGSRSIRARLASDIAGPLSAESEVTLYAADTAQAADGANLGKVLTEMDNWSYGLPSATALPDGDVIVVFYAGRSDCMNICWTRLAL